MCVCLCILASSRIPDMILEDKLLISEVVLSHKDPPKTIQIGVAPRQSINPRGAPHPPQKDSLKTLWLSRGDMMKQRSLEDFVPWPVTHSS
jgi:hypothetical protein